MYYKNLRAEMVRNGISKHEVQELLEIRKAKRQAEEDREWILKNNRIDG